MPFFISALTFFSVSLLGVVGDTLASTVPTPAVSDALVFLYDSSEVEIATGDTLEMIFPTPAVNCDLAKLYELLLDSIATGDTLDIIFPTPAVNSTFVFL